MNDPLEIDDIDAAIDQTLNNGVMSTVANIDANPDDGARAIEFSRATGVPPSVIYNDPDFARNHRTQLAAELVRDNPAINMYVQSDPMASIVSNDDYGNLQIAANNLQQTKIWSDKLVKSLPRVSEQNAELTQGKTTLQWVIDSIPNYQNIPHWVVNDFAEGYNVFSNPDLPLGNRALGSVGMLFSVLTGASKALVRNPVLELTGDLHKAEAADLLVGIVGPGSGISAVGKGSRAFARASTEREAFDIAFRDAADRAAPFLKSGIEPPTGMHPYIDRYKAEMNARGLESLEADLDIAQNALTKERNPEMYAKFVRQQVEDTQIGISADRVLELYNGKIPDQADGLLGWVPGIEDKLNLARLTGDDIQIPMADWIAYVDPALAKSLREDIRMWRGGVTAREATQIAEPRPVVDAPLAQVRDVAGLEPMFANGDRKVELRKSEERFSDFQDELVIHDADGKPAGYIIVEPRPGTKTLYIDMIQGADINGFGPSAIRDLKRQLKEMYPEYETVTGHRVSGARGQAGTYDGPTAHPEVKLSAPDGWGVVEPVGETTAFMEILKASERRQFHPTVYAHVPPLESMPANVQNMAKIVEDELRLIVGDNAVFVPATRIEATKGQKTRGVFMQYRDRLPHIIIDLFSRDAVGTARHESIHMLRQYGFFKDSEWAALVKAAREEGWIERYDIDTRYSKGSEFLKLEESIAEAFRDWAANRPVNAGAKTPVTGVFERLAELWERIKAKYLELTGKEPTWEELFGKAYEGEIGKRTDFQPKAKGAFDPRLMAEPVDPAITERMETLRANAYGLNKDTYNKYMKGVHQRYADDIAAATERQIKLEKKTLTKEWRENLADVKVEVDTSIRQRPDVAADLFFGAGELKGVKIRQRYSLAADDLTPDQIAALPKQYVSKSGLPADETAQMLGFVNRNELVESLIEYNAAKGNRSSHDMVTHIVNTEAAKIMQQRHGNLDDNIITAAKDRVFSENDINLVSEEVQGIAMQLKAQTIDLDLVKTMVADTFAKLPTTEINSNAMMARIGKLNNQIQTALIEDPNKALQLMQQKLAATIMTKRMIEFEHSQKQLGKVVEAYSKRKVAGPLPEFVPYIQGLLMEAGYNVRKSPDDIARGIETYKKGNLQDFLVGVDDLGNDVNAAFDIIGKVKNVDTMTTQEFADFKAAIDNLNFVGKQMNKVKVGEEVMAFDAYRQHVINTIKQAPLRTRAQQREGKGFIMYELDASMTRTEEIIRDLDQREALGPLWRGIIEPMMTGKANEHQYMTDLAKYFMDTRGEFGGKWRKTMKDTIKNDVIWDPHNRTMFDMKRENMINIMLNWGNRSNIDTYVRGAFKTRFDRNGKKEELALFEAQIKNMLDRNANKLDWDYVQRMWQPFKDWQPDLDRVARETSGEVPKLIKPDKIQTPHGEYEGGFWPVKYDTLASKIGVIKDRGEIGGKAEKLFGPQYFRAATSKGHLKERTGYSDFVDITNSLEQAAGTMQQTIHDISFRGPLIQASKIIYDPAIRAAIRQHMGVEYEKQLVPWLKRVSYQYSVDDKAMSGWDRILRSTRIALISNVLPYNLRVILSPDMGKLSPKAWSSFLANREQNMEFAMEHSKELKHLVYNMDRDYSEAMQKITDGSKFENARKKFVEIGYWPTMKTSQQFRAATFMDEFQRAKLAGKSDADAALIGDIAIRERHGVAHAVDLPAIMNSTEAWKTLTVFMGYFNSMYNWQRQIPGQWRRSEYKKMVETGLGSVVLGAAFGATLFNPGKEDESWFSVIGKNLGTQVLGGIPIASHTAQYAAEGYAPRQPFFSMVQEAGGLMQDAWKYWEGEDEPKKPIQHAANVIGLATKSPMAQFGRTGQFGTDVARDKQEIDDEFPRNIIEFVRGVISGQGKLKK